MTILKRSLLVFVALSLQILSLDLHAEGTVISIEGATIRGNQELPTVLYLVPWQPAKVYALDRPEQTLASSRPFQVIDRASFLRMQSYHEAFSNKHVSSNKAPENLK